MESEIHNEERCLAHPRSTGWWGNLAFLFVFIVLLLMAAVVRFDHIAETGISGNDNWEYVENAVQWAQGNHTFRLVGAWEFYRPATYLMNGLAIRALGANDASLKLLNASLDLLNLSLVFVIAALLSRNRWVGVGTLILCAFLPVMIDSCRSEMPHTGSETFVLLSLLTFSLACGKRDDNRLRTLLLALSASAAALAAHTHMDLVLLGPAYIAAIIWIAFQERDAAPPLPRMLSDSSVFTTSFLLACLVPVLFLGLPRVAHLMGKELGGNLSVIQGQQDLASFPVTAFHLVCGSIDRLTSRDYRTPDGGGFVLLFGGAVLVSLLRLFVGPKTRPILHAPVILVFAYALGYGLLVRAYEGAGQSRLFIPFMPLVMVGVACWCHSLLAVLARRQAGLFTVALCAGLAFWNAQRLPGPDSAAHHAAQTAEGDSTYHEVHAALADRVDGTHRLLVTPYVARHNFHVHLAAFGFRSPVYFGRNALYMSNLPRSLGALTPESFAGAVKAFQVRYLLVEKRNYDTKTASDPQAGALFPGETYNSEKETEFLEKYATDTGAKLLAKADWGVLYDLHPDASTH